jgi:hypothetical protein
MAVHVRVHVILWCLIAILAAGCSSGGGGSAEPKNNVPASVEADAQRLIASLTAQGFEVSRGYFKLWTVDQCPYTFNIMGSCYANNPAAPYITFAVPPWHDEFVSSATSSLWGPSAGGYNDNFRLDFREAIVILGELPPPAAYFSQQTYLFSRRGVANTNSSTYQNMKTYMPALLSFFFAYMPDDTTRFQSFASLSNPINNVVIERQSTAAFGQIRYFIITPDQIMDGAVRKAFAGISIKDGDIFTEKIPSDMRVGLDQAADNFTTLIRYAQPVDGGDVGTPSDTWRKDLPLVVLRVRDPRADRVPQLYPPVALETRTAVDERPLKSDLGSLLYAVSRRWGQRCADAHCSDRAVNFQDLQTFPSFMVGPLCIPIGENCLGDNWDTAYQIYGPASLDNGEIYAVAGTLGTETGNATYVGFGINYVEMFLGVANLSDKDLRGTANNYAGEVSNTGKFYLYFFTRDCTGLKDLTDSHCFEISEKMVPSGKHFAFSVRDYVRQNTQRGPDSSLVLPPEMIKLHRP